MNQLERILEVTGRPSPVDVDSVQSPFAGTMLDSMPAPDTPRLEAMFPTASPEALDLLERLMQVQGGGEKQEKCTRAAA